MPFRRGFGRRRGAMSLNVINSIKNNPNEFTAVPAATNTFVLIAKAVNTPVSTVATDVSQGCKIMAVWVELWVRATAESLVGITTSIDAYI